MTDHGDVPPELNQLARIVIGVAIRVHQDIGPGLLEKPYQIVLAHRLAELGHKVALEVPLRLEVDGQVFDVAYRADIIVDDALLIEIKCVEQIHIAHVMQVKTYLRLAGLSLGLILNFNEPTLHAGIRRVVPRSPAIRNAARHGR